MLGAIRPFVRLPAAARLIIAALIMLGGVITPAVSHAEELPGLPCTQSSLPSNDPRYPSDHITLICIPPTWNTQIVIYAHGYVSPTVALALPAELNLYLPTGEVNPSSLPVALLSQGYAFATTSYHKNGYAIEQGGQDIDALVAYAQQLLAGQITRTYLVGASEGALISTMLLERSPETYNGGALALCGPLSGSPDEIQYLGDFAVVFGYYFPGVAITKEGIAEAFQAHPELASQLFSVTRAAFDPQQPETAVATTLSILSYNSTDVLQDQRSTASGNPYSNIHRYYWGSLDDRALNAGVTRSAASPLAKQYVNRFYKPEGTIKQPIIALHNLLDPIAPSQNLLRFARQLDHAGHSGMLTILPSQNHYGHCNFTQDEVLAAFSMLERQNT